MRFQIDKTSHTHTQPQLDSGWQEAQTPGEMQIQSYGLAASCAGMLLVGAILQGEFVPKGLLAAVLILAFTTPVHELLHAFSTPGWGLSTKTVFGLRQYRGLWTPYVSFDGEQPLWRFLLTGLTPTILLTLLPLMVPAFFPLADPYRAGLGFLAFFNIAISGGDLVLALWFSKTLPLHARVRQENWKLYWKAESPAR
jgi:hypothetical protein